MDEHCCDWANGGHENEYCSTCDGDKYKGISVDGYTIEWESNRHNEDYLIITSPYGNSRRICGGDFSSFLAGLSSIDVI